MAVRDTQVTFLDLESMQTTLTPPQTGTAAACAPARRHQHALADNVRRDYKNVHKDVAALEAAGLLVREGRKLIAPWHEVQASVMPAQRPAWRCARAWRMAPTRSSG